ncbi:unnamed protein product [Cuscuta epithymum]|nr:unnamed protein product [Cuscuta epithymum]
MDPQFTKLPDSKNTIQQQDEFPFSSSLQQSQDIPCKYSDDPLAALEFTGDPLSTSSCNHSYLSPPVELDSQEDHHTNPVFKFLNQILLEENISEKPSMFHDPIALEATEKYFYEALDKNPPSHESHHISHKSTQSSDSMYDNSSEPPPWTGDPIQSSFMIPPPELPFHSSFPITSSVSSNASSNNYESSTKIQVHSMLNYGELGNIFSDTEAKLQFKRGVEEASTILPATNQLVIDLVKDSLPLEEDELEKERSNKQSAVYVEEELTKMFDKVLLLDPDECCRNVAEFGHGLPYDVLNDEGIPHNGGKRRTKKKKQGNTSEVVDLITLLTNCSQSVAADDRKSANEQLTQIRKHCSVKGDVNQRLAYVMANGLEARLSGLGTQLYTSQVPKKITAFEKLSAYKVYMSACPFEEMSIGFGNKMIFMMSLEAQVLHVIDFGIEFGFQWPSLIQHLAIRPGGPPKFRITGIELPEPGSRPAELIEETGRRLGIYCERFHVPFEYNAIATQNWETLKVEDLKLVRGEMVAVKCSYRLQNLLDVTVMGDSPRDAVLKLIRELNPSVFVHSVISGSYSAPFFVTRFREALFYYSAVFDMFENTLPRDDEERFLFEQEFYGRESLNVIACEGEERIVRPETYKKWQVRTMRAGFKLLPVMPGIMIKIGKKLKAGYHENFMLEEDGHWMLQGWKGRILCASSCWVPS